MAKKSDDKKLRPDVNETAFRIMREATGQAPKTVPPGERSDAEKDPEAVKRGRKGGTRGGHARAAKLSPKERSELARSAAESRWEDEDD